MGPGTGVQACHLWQVVSKMHLAWLGGTKILEVESLDFLISLYLFGPVNFRQRNLSIRSDTLTGFDVLHYQHKER